MMISKLEKEISGEISVGISNLTAYSTEHKCLAIKNVFEGDYLTFAIPLKQIFVDGVVVSNMCANHVRAIILQLQTALEEYEGRKSHE